MSIRNHNWYNLQSTRRYPLDDTSTGDDDLGGTLRDDILVDCNIRFPSTLGRFLYIQAITVSPGLVTVVFGVGRQYRSRDNASVAAVSLARPVTPNINYSVSALVPGVAGWITFGPGIETNFSARYSTPQQSLIAPRCGRMYSALPIQTIGKLNIRDTLQGIVNLTVTQPLAARYEDDAGPVVTVRGEVAGTAKRAIVVGLDQSLITDTYNPLKIFAGPCSQRPESNTCEQTPIESINGIQPDCAGNIELVFDNLAAELFDNPAKAPFNCGGMDVLTDISLQASCASIPDPKKEFTDICCANEVQEGRIQDEFCWPDPTPDLIIEDVVNPSQPCVEFPICLNSCDATAHFSITAGSFLSTLTAAPPPNATGRISAEDLAERYVLAATPSAASVAVLKNCATDWAANKRVRTTLKLTALGVEKNGGVLLNYKSTSIRGRLIKNYVAVVVEAQSGKIKVLRFNGDVFIEEHTAAFNAKPDVWYDLSVIPIMTSDTAAVLNITLVDRQSGVTGSATATVAEYGNPTGYQGVFAQRSYTYFHSFEIA